MQPSIFARCPADTPGPRLDCKIPAAIEPSATTTASLFMTNNFPIRDKEPVPQLGLPLTSDPCVYDRIVPVPKRLTRKNDVLMTYSPGDGTWPVSQNVMGRYDMILDRKRIERNRSHDFGMVKVSVHSFSGRKGGCPARPGLQVFDSASDA
jgi:hypothetical protein